MKIFGTKKSLQLAIIIFLTSTLVFTQACYAEDTASTNATNSTLLSAGGVATALAIGGGIPLLLSFLVKRSTTNNYNNSTPTEASIDSIIVIPNNTTIAVGDTQQFTAIGKYSNNLTKDITGDVTWDSSDKTMATIDNTGKATALAITGSTPTTITATLSGKTGQTTLTTIQGGPVILSSSSHNLLSYDGAIATGTVFVKNNSNTTRTISIASTISPITSSTNTCSNVAAWGTCQFNISYYYGWFSGETTVNFQVNDDSPEQVTDAISIKTIRKTTGTFFDPSIEGTNAHGLPFQPTTFVTANKNGINLLYTAATDSNNYKYYGVFRSSDGGISWTTVNNGLGNPTNKSINSLYGIDHNLCVTTDGNGILFSTNAGENWTQSSGISTIAVVTTLSKGKNLYVGTNSLGIFYSTNQGAVWNKITTGISDIDSGKIVALHAMQNASTNDTLHVITYSFPFNNVYQGTPTSATTWDWTLITDLSTNNVTTSLYAANNYIFAGTSNGIYRSNDNGTTWSLMANSPTSANNFCIIGGYLYASASNVIYKSVDNGTTWTPFNTGLTGASISSLNLINNQLYIGTDLGVYTMLATSSGWNLISPMLTTQILMSLSNNNYSTKLYTAVGKDSGYGSGVFVSSDKGANWSTANNGLTNLSINVLYSDDSYLYAGTNGGGVFKSADGGNNWIAMGLSGKNIMSLYSKDNTLYVGTNLGGVWKSTNNGIWEEIGDLAGENVMSLSMDKKYQLYVGLDNKQGIRKCNNDNCLINLLPGVSTRALYYDTSTSTLYAGTQRGMYYKTDTDINFTLTSSPPSDQDSIQTFYNTATALYAGLVPYSSNAILMKNGNSWAGVGNIGSCEVYSLSSLETTLYVASSLGGIRKNGP